MSSATRSTPRAPAALGAAQQRANPGEQLRVEERLAHVVVGPAGEAAHAIGLAGAPGQDDHRQLRVDPGGEPVGCAHAVEQLEAVAVLERQVQQERGSGARASIARSASSAPAAREHAKAVRREVVHEEAAGGLVVFHEQYRAGVVHARMEAVRAENSPPAATPVATGA